MHDGYLFDGGGRPRPVLVIIVVLPVLLVLVSFEGVDFVGINTKRGHVEALSLTRRHAARRRCRAL